MNTPDPPHWTLNSCIGAFCSVPVHFLLFHCFMKLGAKWAELEQLMQKFVPQSRIGNLCNEHSRSTTLDTKLMFWCVSFNFGCIWDRFATCTKHGAKRANLEKLMQKFVPHRWTLNSYFGAFLSIRCVGTDSLLHETRCKMRQTVAINAKVSVTKSCHNFTQSALLIHNT